MCRSSWRRLDPRLKLPVRLLRLHIDAYRLSSVAEFRDLALEDYIAESITAVEWGDIVEQDFPNALTIDFEFVEHEDNWRTLTFSAAAERWQPVLDRLRTRLQV